jgi:hypothetical protein
MTSLVQVASQLLEPREREAVLGDLSESGENAWRGLLGVLGLVIRREALLWRNWRPWLAVFGLSMPASFLLMGFSLSVSWSYQRYAGSGAGLGLLISQVFLLIAWSWTSGFVVGSLSRRTLWVSILATFSPCLFCLARFRQSSLPPICLLLFLAPAIWGACRGLRMRGIELRSAMLLAVAITAAMFPFVNTLHVALIWPAWYLVATARKARLA